jgi:hypothetical protein
MKQKKNRKIKPSQFFPFILIIIAGIILLSILLSDKPVQVYRANTQKDEVALKPIRDKIDNIFEEESIETRYIKLEETKEDLRTNRGNIPEPVIQAENQLIRDTVSRIQSTKEYAESDPLNTLPDFQQLISLYEQLPQLPVADSMEELKQSYTKDFNSGEKDLIQKYITLYNNFYPIYEYFNEDAVEIIDTIAKNLGYKGIEGWEESKQELIQTGVRLVEYLQARYKIANETEDLLWAYDIAKETIPLYSDIPFNNKLPGIEAELIQHTNRIKYLWQDYSEEKNIIQEKIREAEDLYRKISLSIEQRISELDKMLKDADKIKRSFSLKKSIIRFQNELVKDFYNDFENEISNMLNQYVTDNGFQNIINKQSSIKLKSMCNNYLDKDFVLKFYRSSNMYLVMGAKEYLNTLSIRNIKFAVNLNNLVIDENLGKISVSIGTYDASKEYDGRKIISHSTTKKVKPVEKDNRFIYEYDTELIFPYETGTQIIIRFESDKEGLKWISSNNIAYPEDKRGYHFQVFSETEFQYHNMNIDFDTNNLPQYPAFFGKLF